MTEPLKLPGIAACIEFARYWIRERFGDGSDEEITLAKSELRSLTELAGCGHAKAFMRDGVCELCKEKQEAITYWLNKAANHAAAHQLCAKHGDNRHHGCVECHRIGQMYNEIRQLADAQAKLEGRK